MVKVESAVRHMKATNVLSATRDVMLRNKISSVKKPSYVLIPKNILAAWLLLTTSILANTTAHSAWFERLIPQGETYTVREIDRDLAFVIDGFIYDARTSCFLAVGDRVIFFEGLHQVILENCRSGDCYL